MKHVDASTVHGLSREALQSGGAATSALAIDWVVAPWCTDLVHSRHWHTQTKSAFGEYIPGREVNVFAGCRKCAGCLEHRRKLWTARAIAETLAAYATFMVTLTLRPEDRYTVVDALAFARRTTPSGELTFHERSRALVPLIQRYVKRVRKGQPPLRYMWVIEPHKDGYPHVHILWHLQRPLGEYKLDGAWPSFLGVKWPHGFTTTRQAAERNARAAYYVAKYLGKEEGCAIRASLGYGTRIASSDEESASATRPREAPSSVVGT